MLQGSMASPRKDDLAKVDLESPRMIAAMKVTGIDIGELSELKFDEAEPSSSRQEESQQRRMELMDRKRRQLMRELDDTAAALDDSLVEAILSPSAMDAVIAMDSARVLEDEKSKIDDKRRRVKSEIQRELDREMKRMQAYASNQQSREDWRKRLKEKHDETADERQKWKDEKDKRIEKQEQTLNKTRKEDWTKRKETMKKIEENNDRVNKQAEERTQAWANLSEERRKKLSEIVQKSMDIQRGEEDDKIRKFEIQLAKQREREDRIEKAAEEALNKKREKHAHKMTVVNDCLQDQQRERERVFKENTEKMERARQAAKERFAEVAEKTRTNREKEMSKWLGNREAQRKERKAEILKLRNEFADSHTKSLEVREKYLEEMVYKKADMQSCMKELVDQNKARLARSEECAREQTLAKIRHTKDKIESNVEKQKQVNNYRTNAIREEMIGRTQLNELKVVMRDQSTKRINTFLKELDLPLLPTEAVKEEAEDDKKQ